MVAPARRMLTSEEAADYCGFKSVNGFLAYVKISPVKFGKSVRYDRLDLDEFLDRFRLVATGNSFVDKVGHVGAHRGR